jgi:hypothetical protein
LRTARRFVRSRRLSEKVAVGTLLPLIVAGFVFSLLTFEATRSWAVTFEIGIGTMSALDHRAGVAGELLALTGYLIVPALAGTLFAYVWERVREPER